MGRRRTITAMVVAPLGLLVLAAPPLHADPPELVVFGGGSAAASSLSIELASNAFPDMPLVGLQVPRSSVTFDTSPSSAATSSWFDTGPVGQLVASEAGFEQPQYAAVRFPGVDTDQRTSLVEETDPSGAWSVRAAIAAAEAGENSARATAELQHLALLRSAVDGSSLLGGSLRSTQSPQVPSTGGVLELPKLAGADETALLSIGTSSTGSEVTHADGWIVAGSETVITDVSLAGGLLRIGMLQATARAASNGTEVESEARMELSGARLGGVPVEIGAEGLRISEGVLPLGTVGLEVLSDLVNEVLAAAGASVAILEPSTTVEGGAVSVAGGGLMLGWDVPVPDGAGFATADLTLALGGVEAAAFASVATDAVVTEDDDRVEPGAGRSKGSPEDEDRAGAEDALSPPIDVPPADEASAPPVSAPGPPPEAVVLETPAIASPPMEVVGARTGGRALLAYAIWQLLIVATAAEGLRACSRVEEVAR